MLGVAGNTETGGGWPLSKAHNPSGIVTGIRDCDWDRSEREKD